jgi:hypothetical protein
MAKEYAFDAVKPDMRGGINYWSKILGMGSANIRTAIRGKTLVAHLVPLREDKPELVGYQITGQEILDWRAAIHGKGEGGPTGPGLYVYKTNVKLSQEDVDKLNATLIAAGSTVTLVRNTKEKTVKAQPENDGDEMPTLLTADAQARLDALNEEPVAAGAPVSSGFGKFNKKH